MAQAFQINLRTGVPFQVIACGWILLMSRHARNRVVKYDYRGIRFIVSNVNQTGDAGMDKCGIADDRHSPSRRSFLPGLYEAVKPRDGSAHTHGSVNGAKRRYRS